MLPGVEHRFVIGKKVEERSEKKTRLSKTAGKSKSMFQTKSAEFGETNNSDDEFFSYIKSLTPAAIDVELRSLVDLNHLQQFMRALQRRLKSHKESEAVQMLQNIFLRIHGDSLFDNEKLLPETEELIKIQETESKRILEPASVNYRRPSMDMA